ncbi:MAG: hypothetical protein HC825_05285 [Oscillatoriales cyanobacterium RM1_1_9]|nr:hypothetical protein [Oscillatoriales cyanobacterium RM1_1_9]
MRKFTIAAATASAILTLSITNIAPAEAGTIKRTIDFDTREQANGKIRNLGAGTVITNQWSNYGLKIDAVSKTGQSKDLTLFNTNCFDHSCSGGDSDLATGSRFGTTAQGNALIIQEQTTSTNRAMNSNKTKFLTPDDDASGGTITFDFSSNPDANLFSNLVQLDKIALLDLDDNNRGFPTLTAYYYSSTGHQTTKTLTLSDYQKGSKNVSLISSATGDNSMWEFDFGNLDRVYKLDVGLPGSGAIGLCRIRTVHSQAGSYRSS